MIDLKPTIDVLSRSTERVRIRIIRQPEGREFAAFSIWRFAVGRVYEVGPNIGKLLIVSGFAEPDAAGCPAGGP